MAETVAEIFVDLPCEKYLSRMIFPAAAVGEEIGGEKHVATLRKFFDKRVISSGRDSLPGIVEIIVVESEAQRQAADDEGGKFRAWASPLLFGIVADEDFVNLAAHEKKGLLLEVSRFGDSLSFKLFHLLGTLSGNLRASLLGSHLPPQRREGVHVEGEIEEAPVIVGYR